MFVQGSLESYGLFSRKYQCSYQYEKKRIMTQTGWPRRATTTAVLLWRHSNNNDVKLVRQAPPT